MLTSEPYTPGRRLQTTITPRNINARAARTTRHCDLAVIAKTESFDKAQALEFKDKGPEGACRQGRRSREDPDALNASSTEWTNRAQVVEQAAGKAFRQGLHRPHSRFLPRDRLPGGHRRPATTDPGVQWALTTKTPETYTDPFVTAELQLARGSPWAYAKPDGRRSTRTWCSPKGPLLLDMTSATSFSPKRKRTSSARLS